jgi:predicted nuclease with TOPRIM domain
MMASIVDLIEDLTQARDGSISPASQQTMKVIKKLEDTEGRLEEIQQKLKAMKTSRLTENLDRFSTVQIEAHYMDSTSHQSCIGYLQEAQWNIIDAKKFLK